ncbi:TetR/AcrR family transcriptional regulator [Pengzhenrongella sp.]|jgi:AcrR family transcriptional regulator|uniref:TetR/AcrR family transcriptional regulator n=1 Tax=Pengzhenrongella sp. TaxID=2888820 RepID=UPI002F95EB22
MGRPREHGEAIGRELLAVAAQVLASEGADAVTIRRLADEVGTTTRAIYTVFGGRQGVFEALYRQAVEGMVERHELVARFDDPLEEILALALAYRAGAMAHPSLYGLLFPGSVPEFRSGRQDARYARRSFDRVRATVERGILAGTFPSRDPVATTVGLWAAVHGLASLELLGVLGADALAVPVWRETMRSLLTGFAAPPGVDRPLAASTVRSGTSSHPRGSR